MFGGSRSGGGGGKTIDLGITVGLEFVSDLGPEEKYILDSMFTSIRTGEKIVVDMLGNVEIDLETTAWDRYNSLVESLERRGEDLAKTFEQLGKIGGRLGDLKLKKMSDEQEDRFVANLLSQLKSIGLGAEKARKVLGLTREEWKKFKKEGGSGVLADLKKDADAIDRKLAKLQESKTDKLDGKLERTRTRLEKIEDLFGTLLQAAEQVRSQYDGLMEGVVDGITSGFDAVGALDEVQSAYKAVIDARDSFVKSDAELAALNPRELREYRNRLAELQADVDNFNMGDVIAEANAWRAAMDPAKVTQGWKDLLALQRLQAGAFAGDLETIRQKVLAGGGTEAYASSLVADLASKGPEAAGEMVSAIADGIRAGDGSLLAAFTDTFDQIQLVGENFIDNESFQRGIYNSVLEGMKKSKTAAEEFYKKFPLQVTAELVLTKKQARQLAFLLPEGGVNNRAATQVVVQGNIVDPAGAAAAIRRVLRDQDAREGAWSW